MKKQGRVIAISAPSGCGKSTLCRMLARAGLGLVLSVSATTRRPRGKESDGREYIFITRQEFLKRIKRGSFLEWAKVFGSYYGTPKEFVKKAAASGKGVLLDIDVQGAMQVKKKIKDALLIFILPPSLDELKRRLKKRKTETDAQLGKRLAIAKKEISYLPRYDYALVNDDLKSAYNELRSIILNSKRG